MGKHTWTGPKGKCGQIPRKKYILSCISPWGLGNPCALLYIHLPGPAYRSHSVNIHWLNDLKKNDAGDPHRTQHYLQIFLSPFSCLSFLHPFFHYNYPVVQLNHNWNQTPDIGPLGHGLLEWWVNNFLCPFKSDSGADGVTILELELVSYDMSGVCPLLWPSLLIDIGQQNNTLSWVFSFWSPLGCWP